MNDPGLVGFISVILAASVFLLTLISTDAAIILLIFSMLLSPEITMAQLHDRAVVIRFDDLLLGVVFFTWLAKLAINKQLSVLRSTPMNVPLAAFILSGMVSTGWGVITGTVANPVSSLFYFVKYVEYFFLFFMVANVIHHRRQVERFLYAMLATAVIVSLCAYWQMVSSGVGGRVTAPFEGKGEPNTLAGYLVLICAVCLGLAVQKLPGLRRIVYLTVTALMLLPLVYTYSRGGYLAFVAMYLTLCVAPTRFRPILWSLLVLGALMPPPAIAQAIKMRFAEAFDPSSAVMLGGMGLSASPAYRLTVWKLVFEKWLEHPLLGFGVTGLGFLADNQHALIVGEMGLIGLAAYVWVRWRLLAISYRHFRMLDDPLAKGLSLGFLAGLVGLLIHSFAGNIFIIVRIMEPFWFLAAVVVVLPNVVGPPAAPAASPAASVARSPARA